VGHPLVVQDGIIIWQGDNERRRYKERGEFLPYIYKSVLYLSRSHILFFSEKGKFLALDLGGTNFRVLIVELNGRDVDIQKFPGNK
jgi:hexokinase